MRSIVSSQDADARDASGVRMAAPIVVAVLALLLAAAAFSLAPAKSYALSSSDFTDVSGHWSVNDASTNGTNWIDYVASHGIMTGRTENGVFTGKFGPDDTILRCEFATTLYRMAVPESDATTNSAHFGQTATFTDEGTGEYYTAAIEWCYRNGIMIGDTGSNGPLWTVRPNDPITREEMATMLYRFACVMCLDTGSDEVLKYDDSAYLQLPDHNYVDAYAVTGMGWCASRGIIGSNGSLNPHANATRAESAKMLSVLDRDVLSDTPAYGILYDDGTLVLQRGGSLDESRGGRLTVDSYGKVSCTDGVVGRWGNIESLSGVVPWTEPYGDDVKSIVVADAVAPANAENLFASLPNLVSVDLANLDLTSATTLRNMFEGDASLTTLDLSAVNVNASADSYGIVQGCFALQSVKLGTGSASLASSLKIDDSTTLTSSDGVTYVPAQADASAQQASTMASTLEASLAVEPATEAIAGSSSQDATAALDADLAQDAAADQSVSDAADSAATDAVADSAEDEASASVVPAADDSAADNAAAGTDEQSLPGEDASASALEQPAAEAAQADSAEVLAA
jgi:hypothetical protein